VSIAAMMKDPRFEVAFQPVCDYRPFEYARNRTIDIARSMAADWLISFDNDNFLEVNPLDIIAAAGDGKDVIGVRCGVGQAPDCAYFIPNENHGAHGVRDGSFREEEYLGGSVLMIRCTVWQKIPIGPWFRWQPGNNELLAPGEGGHDEVTGFCRLVRKHGFRVWAYLDAMAGHLKTCDLTKVIAALAGTR